MKFSLDKEKAAELAKKLDIKLTFNHSQADVTISANGDTKDFEFEDFFPELRQDEKYIIKDRDIFLGSAPIKKTSSIVIVVNSEPLISISSSNKLTGAA